MSPVRRASGKQHVVLARHARNRDACYLWAFAALTASPAARAYYDQHRTNGDTHHCALRAVANGSSRSFTADSDTASRTTNTPPGHTDTNTPLDMSDPWDTSVYRVQRDGAAPR